MEAAGAGAPATRHPEPGKEPCVDHVYVSGRLAARLEAAWVVDRPPFAADRVDAASWACSDHFPVVVELRDR
jgi:endonuclease/exonuclease/phosphatase family metal-dependent hydrolase